MAMQRLPDHNQEGFTLVELVVVIGVMGLLLFIAGASFGTFSFWQEEAFLRRLMTTAEFLHHQAPADSAYYAIRFNLDDSSYEVGILRAESDVNSNLSQYQGESIGNLTLELADFLDPSHGDGETFIPPPNYPSLAEKQVLPQGAVIEQVKTSAGIKTKSEGGVILLTFSPQGFSDFGVITLTLSSGQPMTLLVDPFSGEVRLYRERKDFEWKFGSVGTS